MENTLRITKHKNCDTLSCGKWAATRDEAMQVLSDIESEMRKLGYKRVDINTRNINKLNNNEESPWRAYVIATGYKGE